MTARTLALSAAFFLAAVGACDAPEIARSLDGVTIRCLAQDASGAVWLGLDEGLAVLRPGATEPNRLDLQPLAATGVNAILPDGACLWLGTDTGLFRYADGAVARIDMLGAEATLPDVDRVERVTLNAAVRSLCLHQGKVWLGTDAAIMTYDPADGQWTLFRDCFVWMGVSGALYGNPQPITGCRQLLVDRGGRLWALTAIGLVTLSTPGNVGFSHWQTGYRSVGDGDDSMLVGFWQVTAGMDPAIRDWTGEYYGPPAAIGLDAFGGLRLLAGDGAILEPPRAPSGAGGAIYGTYRRFSRIVPQGTEVLAQARAFAWAPEGVVIAGESPENTPTLCVCSPDLRTGAFHVIAREPATINDLLVATDGRVLVATDRGLFAMPCPSATP